MSRLIVYHAVGGGWAWELVGEAGEVRSESHQPFEEREDCIDDALTHGAARDTLRELNPGDPEDSGAVFAALRASW
jgi:hypothetical protein